MERRNTGVELLRIFLMLLIIVGHLFCHTGIRAEYAMQTPSLANRDE